MAVVRVVVLAQALVVEPAVVLARVEALAEAVAAEQVVALVAAAEQVAGCDQGDHYQALAAEQAVALVQAVAGCYQALAHYCLAVFAHPA